MAGERTARKRAKVFDSAMPPAIKTGSPLPLAVLARLLVVNRADRSRDIGFQFRFCLLCHAIDAEIPGLRAAGFIAVRRECARERGNHVSSRV